jgi:ankyrin repeat protein
MCPTGLGQTPLSFAIVVASQTGAVQLLLARHADPNVPVSRQGETALQYAVRSSNVGLASILISGGAQLDTKGPGGRTALHIAVAGDRLDALHLLLEKSADPNVRDAESGSPLDDAVWRGSLDSTAILLAHGARLNEPHT